MLKGMPPKPSSASEQSAHLLEFDQLYLEELNQIRVARLKLMQFLLLVILAVYIVFHLVSSQILGVISLGTVAAICLVSEHFLRVRKNLTMASIIHMSSLFISILAGSLSTGCLESPAIWTLSLLPVIGSCLFDTRGTVVCALITLACFTLVAVVDMGGGLSSIAHTTSELEDLIVCAIMLGSTAVTAKMTSKAFVQRIHKIDVQRQSIAQAHERSRSANLAKSRFLARMSHELRTPMNGLLGITQHLQQETLSEETMQAVDIVHRCGENLQGMLNDALDRSKVDSSEISYSHRPVDLTALLKDVTSLFVAKAKLDGIGIHLDADSNPMWVRIDPTRVRQVVSNLVGNALRYSDQGTIRVSMGLQEAFQSEQDATLWIEVRDEGIGMDQEQISRLFQAFSQVHDPTRNKSGGTGLGLAISQRLVQGMGGKIVVESEPGIGSAFRVFLPYRPAQASNVNENQMLASCEAKALQGRTILVVDDNEINLRVATLSLERLGLRCEKARDGHEALDRYKRGGLDAIFMDIRMPNMDGLQATRAIRELEGGRPGVPIIALTANAYHEDRVSALEAGMNGYIAKPFKRSQLQETLLEALYPRPDDSKVA